MSTRTPSVSVVVTTFNHERFIRAALDSVLAQTHAPMEIIVIDDGSTDHTPNEIAHFGPRVRHVRLSNRGVAGARNAGVQLATGDLIALLDGDDLWHPEKLRVQAEAFRLHPGAGMIAVQSLSFDSLSEARLRMTPSRVEHVSVDCRDRLGDLIESNFVSTTSQVVFPSRVLRDVGMSNTRYRTCSDFDLYLRVGERWPIAMCETALCFWRYMPSTASGPQATRGLVWWPELADILQRHAPELPPPLARKARQRAKKYLADTACLAYDGARTGRDRTTLTVLRRGLRAQPLNTKLWTYLLLTLVPTPLGGWLRNAWRRGVARIDARPANPRSH